MFAEMPCSETPTQVHGHSLECWEKAPHLFGSTCQFESDIGYELPVGGVSKVTCAVILADSLTPQWDGVPTAAIGRITGLLLLVKFIFV